jgi:hypothetical protein
MQYGPTVQVECTCAVGSMNAVGWIVAVGWVIAVGWIIPLFQPALNLSVRA